MTRWCAVLAAGLACACATTPSLTAPATTTLLPEPPPEAEGEGPPRDISAEAYRAVLEAELKLQEGDVVGGIALLREAALQDPRSAYLRVRLADAYLEGGDVEQAREAAEEALQLQPRSVDALLVLAQAQRLAGDGEAAERTLARLLAKAPGNRDGSLLLAELKVERGDVSGAEKVIENLMEREPGAVDGYIGLARVFAERGDVTRAFQHADRALARESDDPDALALKLTLLFARGSYAEALPVARLLAGASGDTVDVRQDLLAAHALAGELATADELARAWLEDDSSEEMRLLVSSAWERIGELPRAARALEPPGGAARSPRVTAEAARLLLLGRQPGPAAELACAASSVAADAELATWLHDLCARALVKSGKPKDAAAHLLPLRANAPAALLDAFATVARAGGMSGDEARAVADGALARAPAESDLIAATARVHEELGDVLGARAILEGGLRARPRDAELLFSLARHLERNGQAMAAVEIVERLMDRGPPSIDMLNFVAFTLASERSRGDDARRLAWRALVQDPLSGYVTDTLGWAQRAAGDLETARATLARADRLSPNEGEIVYHRAMVELELGAVGEARPLAERARTLLDVDDPAKKSVDALFEKLGSKP